MLRMDPYDLSYIKNADKIKAELAVLGIDAKKVYHNTSPAVLYEKALRFEPGSYVTNTGALAVSSGAKTGRSPGDKRVVDHADLKDIWWGKVNMKLDDEVFLECRQRAFDYFKTRERLYVVDAYAGWVEKYRLPIRVVCTRAYHALFMENMLVMPTAEELKTFTPKFTIFNAGEFPASKFAKGLTSSTSVQINFQRNQMVILGTEYAGEMKKGVLTLIMYLSVLQGNLCLHSSATIGNDNDLTLFFGLSGTGKTTLSADASRYLIGDDEHVWTDEGVYNVEGGCYAKAVNLTLENEPDIYRAIKFGCVVENVVFDARTRAIDYTDISITENTRCAYALQTIPNALLPARVEVHPQAVVLLCCDAFGVLPPVARLTTEQAMYYFISGYTAKIPGTEDGVLEPTATFSACFGSPFLVWHPMVYAKQLAEKLTKHKATAYLLNTGWVGGDYKSGKRCPIKYTRKLVDAINNGSLATCATVNFPVFNVAMPTEVAGVPAELLNPASGWKGREALYQDAIKKLAGLFAANFKGYADKSTKEVIAAGPQV